MVERYAHLKATHNRRQVNSINGMFSIWHPIAAQTKVVEMGAGTSLKNQTLAGVVKLADALDSKSYLS